MAAGISHLNLSGIPVVPMEGAAMAERERERERDIFEFLTLQAAVKQPPTTGTPGRCTSSTQAIQRQCCESRDRVPSWIKYKASLRKNGALPEE